METNRSEPKPFYNIEFIEGRLSNLEQQRKARIDEIRAIEREIIIWEEEMLRVSRGKDIESLLGLK